jgi:hypothetical protein
MMLPLSPQGAGYRGTGERDWIQGDRREGLDTGGAEESYWIQGTGEREWIQGAGYHGQKIENWIILKLETEGWIWRAEYKGLA